MTETTKEPVLRPAGLIHARNIRIPIAVLNGADEPDDTDRPSRFEKAVAALDWFLRGYGLLGVFERFFGPLFRWRATSAMISFISWTRKTYTEPPSCS